MGYKTSAVSELRHGQAAAVDRLFDRFLTGHRRCVLRQLGGPPTVVLPVPSTSRPGGAPLDRVPGLAAHVLGALGAGRGACLPLWCPGVLTRTELRVGHMRAHRHAFEVPPWALPLVTGGRVLLLDDTYVSGARAQSAAAALGAAGAARVLIVALGRVIRPDKSPEHAALLARSRRDRSGAPRRVPCARCALRQCEAGTGAGGDTE
jgi:hypothetical protein